MSLTRIGSIGINTGIAFAGVTTIVTLNTANDALSIGATVNVGSGITLGASGDIFATGVSTFSGNLKVGSGVTISPDGDGFYTGVVTATSFSGETVVGDTSPQLGGNLDVNTKNILFGDSGGASDDRLIFGAGSDLQLYHDGSNSYLHQQSSATGNLLIFADGHEIQLIPKSGEPGIKVINDGAVELYHNGTKKLETASFGLRSSDSFYVDEHILIDNDSGRIKLGTGADLSIYHDGSHSRIVDSGTGHLIIQTSELDLMNAAGNADLIKATAGGSVELYENGTKVAETTSGGFNVEGVTYSNGLDMDDNHKILLGIGDDLEIFHDGSNSYIKDVGTGDLNISGSIVRLQSSGGETLLRGIEDGAVELYNDNSLRASTMSTGFKILRTVDDSSTTLKLENNSTHNSQNPSVSIKVDLASGKNGGSIDFIRENNYQSSAAADSSIVFKPAKNDTPLEIVKITQDYVRLHSNSAGIQFNSDTADANALNDYEEGTWTPGGDWDTVVGVYTKIGRVVHAAFQVQVNTTGNSSMALTNLPFACGNNEAARNGIFWGWNEWDSTVYGQLTGNIVPGGTTMNLYRMDGSGSAVTYNQLGDNKQLKGVCCYQTA